VDTLEQWTTMLSNLGPAGTAIALGAVPAVAAIASYVTRMASQAKIERLEGEIARMNDNRTAERDASEQRLKILQDKGASDLELYTNRYTELLDRHKLLLKRGVLLSSQIESIAAETAEIAERLDATDYSVLVPAPTSIPGDDPDQLVFLFASGPQAAELKWVRVPVATSLSGQAYKSGQPTIGSPLGRAFATLTDKITHYKTSETLSVPLRYKARRVGVAQFLNKHVGRFDELDKQNALGWCSTLAVRVADFVSDPRLLADMGFAPRSNQYNVSLLFIDLSRYSSLFEMLDNGTIIDILNQYFDELSTIASRYGARIDQYIGDGAFIVFNPDQNQQAHQEAALNAAKEMRASFQSMRKRWVTLGYAGIESTFVRIGLSSGLATRAEIGSSQSRRTTFIGPEVNSAAYACESGERNCDTICVTGRFAEALSMDLGALKPIAESIYTLQD
jgi:class 3 adenylate cyclase